MKTTTTTGVEAVASRLWPRETRFVPRENRPFWKLRERRRREQDETKMVAERETKTFVFGDFRPNDTDSSDVARAAVHR